MWRTPGGNRVLRGAEAKLFARGVLRLLPELGKKRTNDNASAKAFYRLGRSQQLAVLAQVVNAMFRRSVDPPEHTQVNEAAIAAVFDSVAWLITEEIHEDHVFAGGPVRRLVRQVIWRHLDGSQVPFGAEDNIRAWRESLGEVMDLILWDRDFEDDHDADTPPEQETGALGIMGIAPHYFTAAVVPPPAEVGAFFEDWVRSMCESIV